MANKKKNSTQPTLFDISAVARQPVEKVSTKKTVEPMDLTSLGLVSLTEGKSKVYTDFTDYIKRSNILK